MSVDSSVEREILSLESRRFAAMVSKDIAALETVLADDLSYTHSSGRTDTKASFLELVRSGHYLGVERRNTEVVSCGNAAIVRGRAEMHVIGEGGSDLSYPVLYLDVYAPRGDGWRLVAWQATRARE